MAERKHMARSEMGELALFRLLEKNQDMLRDKLMTGHPQVPMTSTKPTCPYSTANSILLFLLPHKYNSEYKINIKKVKFA